MQVIHKPAVLPGVVLAGRHNVQLMVYTVNWPIVAWFIRTYYSRVWLCTDHPERFLPAPSIITVPED